MLNVLEIINSLKEEIKDLTDLKNTKQKTIDKYERELGPLKAEVQDISDTLSNLEMAYESLMLTTEPPKTDANAVHAEEHQNIFGAAEITTAPTPHFTEDGMLIGEETKKRKMKGVVKKDAQGNVMATYRSVAEAARDNGFDPGSLRNIITKISKDKQIRQRGVYYIFAA